MLDLANPSDREALEELISNDVEAFCATYYESGHRSHLGASELGEECWRKLWYSFRWVKQEQFSGRMLRLFNVGHSAEPRFITYLRGIGFEVREFSEDGKQFRINGAKGHYGGSLDGMCKAPARYGLTTDLVLLNEYKTSGTGSAYNSVAAQALAKAKPRHFMQMSQYAYHYRLEYGLYLIENKNDSSITFKVVKLDWNVGKQLEQKAEEIIFAKEAPARISDNPAFQACKWCHHSDICHNNEPVAVNCRSCRHAEPIDNAEWHCHRFGMTIPKDFISKGCEHHVSVT